MTRLLLIGLFSGLTIGSVCAQTRKVDSLRTVLARYPQADTVRVHRLTDLAKALRVYEGQYDSVKIQQSDRTFEQALKLAKQLHYSYGQALTLYSMANAYLTDYRINFRNLHQCQTLLEQALPLARRSQAKGLQVDILRRLGNGIASNALTYYQQALALSKGWPPMPELVELYNAISQYYNYSTGDYPQALTWQFRALKTAQSLHQTSLEVRSLLAISTIYQALTDYSQALAYGLKAQPIARQYADQQAVLRALGNCYRLMGRYPQAITVYRDVLNDSTRQGIDRAYSIVALGDAYERNNNLPQAFRYAFEAIRLTNQNPHPKLYMGLIDGASLTLCRAYEKQHRLDSALYYGRQAADMGRYFNSKSIQRDASQLLGQLHAQRRQYDSAYSYLSKYVILKDSLNNEEVTRKATAIRFTDQMNRQQSQIALLQKDKQLQAEETQRQRLLLVASIAVLVLILGLAAVLYRNNRNKQKANALLQTQRDQITQALTELRATQNQLIQKEKLASLGELTAGIAHEIQNPLNFVNNFSEVSAELVGELKEERQKGQARDEELEAELLDDLAQNLQKIHQHGQRASGIVKGMLEHSRSSTGAVEPTDVNALAEEYLRLSYHGQRAKDNGFVCELVTDFDPAVGQVGVMAQELGRVLLNLYNNAFYAVGERQKQGEEGYQAVVRVSTLRTSNGIEIGVSDNGTGMSGAVEQKIFQPFFTTKPTGEGTGLGLSLSYDIITKGHGGTLSVESTEGEGTTFMVKLPG